MRYSNEKKSKVVEAKSHEEFQRKVFEGTNPEERGAGLLLVGGSSSRHQVVRQAQAALRLDSLASYWSHAAIVLNWENGHRPIGAEVTWEPSRQYRQVPERNGVTLFPLSRYLNNPDEYPNLAFASFSFTKSKIKSKSEAQTIDSKAAIRNAVLHPNQDRFRYRFLDWLGIWGGYTYQPHGQINPLLNDVPVPGAALCEYAFEAAGIDLTPGATTSNACPELLWSTLLYWYKRIGEHVDNVKLFTVLGDPSCRSREPLSVALDEEFQELTRERKARGRKEGNETLQEIRRRMEELRQSIRKGKRKSTLEFQLDQIIKTEGDVT